MAHTPIEYRVERIRDGRTASHRSVVASQGDREVFRQLVAFQRPRPGLAHSGRHVAPAVGVDPAALVEYRAWVAEQSDNVDHPWFAEDLPIELRLENPAPIGARSEAARELRVWMRLSGPVERDDPHVHAAPAGVDE